MCKLTQHVQIHGYIILTEDTNDVNQHLTVCLFIGYTAFPHFFTFFCFRTALSISCTTIRHSKSLTRETFEYTLMLLATDGILSLTAMNVVVPCQLNRCFTLTGVEGFQTSTVIIPLRVTVRTFHVARLALKSG